MICKWCNREVQNNTQFCTYCGKELNDANNNINPNSTSVNFGNPFEKTEEKVNVGLAILSWFIPLVGLILFLVKKDDKPKTAKACGLCALISFILNLVVVIVAFAVGFNAIFSVVNDPNNIYNNDGFIVEDDNDFDISGDTDNDIDVGEVASDWQKYEILVNGTTLTLPLDYSELSRLTGFTFKSSYLESYLSSGYYTLTNMYVNDKLALHVEILNDTDSDLLYTECAITRVSQTKYQISNGAMAIVFPGGLKVGDEISESELINLFGTPNDIDEYSSDGYETKTYEYTEDSTFMTVNKYEIRVVNGVIEELLLDHRY